jgi:hypothetical protein
MAAVSRPLPTEIQAIQGCSICGKPTNWGALTIKMGEASSSRLFCETCANSFLLVNTAVSMLLKQFFGGTKVENNQMPLVPK